MDQRPANGGDRKEYLRQYYKKNKERLDKARKDRIDFQRLMTKAKVCPACNEEFAPIYNRQFYCPSCIRTVLGSDAAKEYDLKRAWLLRADRLKLSLLRQRARYYAFRRSMILLGHSPEDPGLVELFNMLIADIRADYDVVKRHADTVVPYLLERTKRATRPDFTLQDFDVPEEFMETVDTSRGELELIDESVRGILADFDE